MARTMENDALTWLGAIWRLVDMVKPVRTIDEVVLVLADLRAQPQGQSPSEPVIHQGQVDAARLAGAAFESSGDAAGAQAAHQRADVLETLRSPLPEADPLAGSLNRIARSGALPVSGDARLQPIAAQNATQVLGAALRGAAGTLAGPAGAEDARREAHVRLQGQKEALQAVADALSTQHEAEPAEGGDAFESVQRTLEARIAAADAAAVALSANVRPAVRQTRPRFAGPTTASPEAATTAARRPRRRRIEIVPKRPVDDV